MKYILIYFLVSFIASCLFGACMAKTKTPEEREQDDIEQAMFIRDWNEKQTARRLCKENKKI